MFAPNNNSNNSQNAPKQKSASSAIQISSVCKLVPNGTSITKNLKITSCQSLVGNTEVYLLNTEQQFLVLPFLTSKKQIQKSYRRRLVSIKTELDNYFGLVVAKNSPAIDQDFVDKVLTQTGLDAVAGMSDLKRILQEQVIWPQLHPERYLRFRVSIPNGILLYGPPGCGKTYIVRKLAEELGYKYFEMVPSSVATPYIHGNVTNVANVFKEAKDNAPAIIFIDEIEGMVPKREDLSSYSDIKREEINEFLVQLNNAGKSKVLVIGATNAPELIDNALLRAGRLDKKVYVGPPDFEARKELIAFYLNGRPQAKVIDLAKLASLTANYSGSDLTLVVEEAARLAVIGEHEVITEDLLLRAIALIPSSLPALNPEIIV